MGWGSTSFFSTLVFSTYLISIAFKYCCSALLRGDAGVSNAGSVVVLLSMPLLAQEGLVRATSTTIQRTCMECVCSVTHDSGHLVLKCYDHITKDCHTPFLGPYVCHRVILLGQIQSPLLITV